MKFPRTSISASLINAYNDCPLAWKLTVIDELLAPEGPALEIGSILDFMFKTYHQGENWFEEAKKKYLKKPNKDTIRNFGTARELMEVYLKDPKGPDKFVKPTFDIRFEVPIRSPITGEEIEGITLKGFLDGFDEGRIKELKSTTEEYDQEKVDKALQATIYIYGKYMLEGKLYPVDYIVVGKKISRVQRYSTTRTLEDLHNLFITIKEFIANVEAEKFEKNRNHPFWCCCRKLVYSY